MTQTIKGLTAENSARPPRDRAAIRPLPPGGAFSVDRRTECLRPIHVTWSIGVHIYASAENPSLNRIRASAILVVFVAHAGFDHFVPAVFGVTVFFFLSGYLIAMLLFNEYALTGSVSIHSFYARRAIRILPPLFIVLFFAYALYFMGLIGGAAHPTGLISQIFFFYNYFEMYSGFYPYGPTGTSALWSLAVEEHYYLILPIIFVPIFCKSSLRFGLLTCLACFAVALAAKLIHYYVFETEPWIIGRSTETRFDSIVFGLLLAILHHYRVDGVTFGDNQRALLVWCLAGLIVLLFCFLYRDEGFRAVYRYTLQGFALMPLFHYAIRRPDHFLFAPLNWRFVQWIGILSYSAYLTHDIILKGLLHNNIIAEEGILLLMVGFILTALISALLYVMVERPLLSLRRRLRERSSPRKGAATQG